MYGATTDISLPLSSLKRSTPLAIPRMLEAGEAIRKYVGNEPERMRWRAKCGDVESPWVSVKHWRCEPAFFAYFLCGGVWTRDMAAKKVGAAPHRGNPRAAKGAKADASGRL